MKPRLLDTRESVYLEVARWLARDPRIPRDVIEHLERLSAPPAIEWQIGCVSGKHANDGRCRCK